MIVLMGVAGAGKSTQGRILSDEHGYAWISTGEILRVLVTGKRRQEMMAGQLLSDDEMIEIMDKIFELVDVKEQCVLDGFPRTMKQAEWLLKQAASGRFSIDVVFNLLADEPEVRRRLEARGRPDDNRDAISLRLEEYEQVTKPIMALFKAQDVPIFDIAGEKEMTIVRNDILGHINELHIV